MRNDIIFGALLPYLTFVLGQHFGLSIVHALALGSLFPIATIMVSYFVSRRIAAVSIITLSATLASLAGSLWFNSAYLALLKNSLITGLIGLVFLGSLFAPRPLIFFLAAEGNREKQEKYEGFWQTRPGFRRTMREMTGIWAAALLGEAILRAVLIPLLPINIFLVVSEVMWIAVFAGMMTWSIRYGKRRSKQLEDQSS
ncbi:hypothetical protein FJU08_08500 [Martelella alba]|uniref:Intracellular septation protein A n=1 Tax=Martelella alba TaxID=2590451 RepID=A0A506UCX3_9HYPH|nr:VC0807 family protein [Martelella alba]TPW31770.1 hypothetical protein FJU08_08500 [Martelella alba]